MTDAVENLILEHFKRFQAAFERIERRLEEHGARLSSLEGGQALIVRHIAQRAMVGVARQRSLDNIDRRLDRIERRLELAR